MVTCLGAGAEVGHPGLRKLHIPTERISIEFVIRLLVQDFGDRPLPDKRRAWEMIVEQTEAQFKQYRSWPPQ